MLIGRSGIISYNSYDIEELNMIRRGSILKPNYPSTEGKTVQQIARERIEQARSKVKPNEFY